MFKPILANADEITDFIIEMAIDQIDERLVREYYYGYKAILKTISIENLKEGNQNQNIRNIRKESRYQKLPIKTMPPLIVENNIVMDGNHRLRAAKKMGVKEIIIYDIIEI
jgi:hypothetical protein